MMYKNMWMLLTVASCMVFQAQSKDRCGAVSSDVYIKQLAERSTRFAGVASDVEFLTEGQLENAKQSRWPIYTSDCREECGWELLSAAGIQGVGDDDWWYPAELVDDNAVNVHISQYFRSCKCAMTGYQVCGAYPTYYDSPLTKCPCDGYAYYQISHICQQSYSYHLTLVWNTFVCGNRELSWQWLRLPSGCCCQALNPTRG